MDFPPPDSMRRAKTKSRRTRQSLYRISQSHLPRQRPQRFQLVYLPSFCFVANTFRPAGVGRSSLITADLPWPMAECLTILGCRLSLRAARSEPGTSFSAMLADKSGLGSPTG